MKHIRALGKIQLPQPAFLVARKPSKEDKKPPVNTTMTM